MKSVTVQLNMKQNCCWKQMIAVKAEWKREVFSLAGLIYEQGWMTENKKNDTRWQQGESRCEIVFLNGRSLLANVDFFVLLVDRGIGRHFDDFLLWKQLWERTLLEQFALAPIAKRRLRIQPAVNMALFLFATMKNVMKVSQIEGLTLLASF